jgi:hypothetical protein
VTIYAHKLRNRIWHIEADAKLLEFSGERGKKFVWNDLSRPVEACLAKGKYDNAADFIRWVSTDVGRWIVSPLSMAQEM